MSKNNGIVMISRERLLPHPKNPRRDLGDLTELAESLKSQGVLQNLTLVPCPEDPDKYYVLIGNRRWAAGELAGLEEFPCRIEENMPEADQIAVMMSENMQRSDLTIADQAYGVQMMFDLGETADSIAEKTGLGKSTVYKRRKLGVLDNEKLREAEARGGTLEDYAAVAEIKNEKTRNKLIDAIGTNNFEWKLKVAKDEQEWKEQAPLIEKEMKRLGVAYDENIYGWERGRETVTEVRIADFTEGCLDKKIKADGQTYTWRRSGGTEIRVVKTTPGAKEEQAKKSAKEKAVLKRNKALAEITEKAYEMRCDFLRHFSGCKKYKDELYAWAMELFTIGVTRYLDYSTALLQELTGAGENHLKEEDISAYLAEHPEQANAVILGCRCEPGPKAGYFESGWSEMMPHHQKRKTLDVLYKHLCAIGYQMSDDEKALQDGTHELFKEEK